MLLVRGRTGCAPATVLRESRALDDEVGEAASRRGGREKKGEGEIGVRGEEGEERRERRGEERRDRRDRRGEEMRRTGTKWEGDTGAIREV